MFTDQDIQSLITKGARIRLNDSGVIRKPVVIDADDVDISGGIITSQCTPAFVVGVKAVPPTCYPPSTTYPGKIAYRTFNRYRLALPNDAFNVATKVLTIEFIVEQTTPATGQVGLFGSIRHQIPQPWYCAVIDGKFEFRFRLANGAIIPYMVPWPTGTVTGKVFLDLPNGVCTITLNGITTNFTIGYNNSLAPSDSLYFGVGALADSAFSSGDYVGASHDWTYDVLKVTGGPSSGMMVNESLYPFCRLLCDAPGPVHCYTGAHYYGFMVDTQQGNRNSCRFHDMEISSSLQAGPVIAVGGMYGVSFNNMTITGGGQNIGTLGGLWTYPVRIRDCSLRSAYDVGFFGHEQDVWMDCTDFQFPAKGALRLQNCVLDYHDGFVGGTSTTKYMMEMRDGGEARFDYGMADFEGLGPKSYFYAEAAKQPAKIEIKDWDIGKPSSQADLVLTPGYGQGNTGKYSVEGLQAWDRNFTRLVDPSWSVA